MCFSACLAFSSFSLVSFLSSPAHLSVARHYFVNSSPTTREGTDRTRSERDERRVRSGGRGGQSLASTFLDGVADADDAATGNLIASTSSTWMVRNCGISQGDITQLCSKSAAVPRNRKSIDRPRARVRVRVVGERENQFSPMFRRRRCPKIHSCSSSLSLPLSLGGY